MAPAPAVRRAGHQHGDSEAIGDYERRSDFVVVAGGKNEVPDEVPDEKLVLHGNCTRKYLKKHPNAIHIEGCPPLSLCCICPSATASWSTARAAR